MRCCRCGARALGALRERRAEGGAGGGIGHMLVAMGKVEQEDVEKVRRMFDALDADGNEKLSPDELVPVVSRHRRPQGGQGKAQLEGPVSGDGFAAERRKWAWLSIHCHYKEIY